MKVLVLGDIGAAGGLHIGDEAMAEGAIAELDSRLDLTVVVVSGDPEETTGRYGWDCVPRIGFDGADWSDADRDARLESVLSAADGVVDALDWDDPAWRVIEAVAASDSVLITGGGNLSSTWPEHVYERAALALVARQFGKPHVVSGQTFGPMLTERHGHLVAELLTSAVLVGAREGASYDLALQLGVPAAKLWAAGDDAAYLPAPAGPLEQLPGEYVAATFSNYGGMVAKEQYASQIVELLQHIVEVAGLEVVLIPHHASATPGERTGDVAFHDQIVAAAGSDRIRSLEMMSSREIAEASRRAAFVVSARYHPVVFGLAGSVPSIGIGVDAYTSTKIGGALHNFGMGDFAISVASLVNGEAHAAFDDAWARRAEITGQLQEIGALRRREASEWWDVAAVALSGGRPAEGHPCEQVAPIPAEAWSRSASALRRWCDDVSTRDAAAQLEMGRIRSAEAQLQARLKHASRELAEMDAKLSGAADEIEFLRASARSAQELAASLGPVIARLEEGPTIDALETELAALYATKTFRALSVPRAIYRRLRTTDGVVASR